MTAERSVAVRLDGVGKIYPNGYVALNDVDLEVEPGEWRVLVGPSGCGKTTTLRIVAGLEDATSGTVRLSGQVANQVPPWRRGVAMVFQRPALAPAHTVRQNLLLGTSDGSDVDVLLLAKSLGIEAELSRLPHQLSGGQQQRVSLGRALARRAPLYLLDEPLSQLDAPLRDQLRRELLSWHQRQSATVISVTHDPREAWALGRRLTVMEQGRAIQTGTPAEIDRKPCNRFVAAFFAQGPLNFFDVQLRRDGKSIQWTAADWPDPIAHSGVFGDRCEATLGLRAEDVRIGPVDSPTMKVVLVEPTRQGAWVTGEVHGRRVIGWTEQAVAVGKQTGFAMDWTRAFVFDRVTGQTLHHPAR